MKIYLADNPWQKTTNLMMKYWKLDGHAVITDPYFNPVKAEWADTIWIEWCEGTAVDASKRKGHFEGVISDHKPITQQDFDWTGKKLINRMVDIEAYYGHFRAVDWNNVDVLTYIAKHIFEMVDEEKNFSQYKNLQTVHIPLGIEVDAWKFKDRKGDGRNIAWVNHSWTAKNLQLAIMGLRELINLTKDKSWKLYMVGTWSNEQWFKPFIEYQIKSLGLQDNVTMQTRVPSVDDFLDEMDFILNTSMKEAFSLITAEAMAKGIKPIIYDWKGSRDIYPEKYIYTTITEMIQLFLGDYHSEQYREDVRKYDFVSQIYPQIKNIIN